MTTKQTKAKQFRNEQLECVSFFEQDKLDENELQSFTQALRKGISNIPQARKAYRLAELQEYKWRPDNQLNNESRKQRDDMYSHFKKIGGELPAVERYYYLIQTEEDIEKAIKAALSEAEKPSKVNIQLHFIIRSEQKDGNITYRPESLGMKTLLSSTTDMLYTGNNINAYSNRELQNLEYFANGFEYLDSAEKYCACFAISFAFYKLPAIGKGGYEELKVYEQWKTWIRINNYDDNLCLFRCLYYHNCNVNNVKIDSVNRVTAGAKSLFEQFYKKKYSPKDPYPGFDWNAEINDFTHTFKINLNVYHFSPTTQLIKLVRLTENGENNELYPYMNVLVHDLYSGDEHFMYCTDLTYITASIGCPNCGTIFKNDQKGRYNLKTHMGSCEGKAKQKLTTSAAVPYCPQFYKNLLYVYCRIHGLEYTPVKYYMTYDFETCDSLFHRVENDEENREQTTLMATLNEFSVVLSWNTPNDGIKSEYFCLYKLDKSGKKLIKNPEFVEDFVDRTLVIAEQIREFNRQEFLKKIPEQHQKNKYFQQYLDRYCRNVSVLGWNSERFDSNFILAHLDRIETERIFILGSTGHCKQLSITVGDPPEKGQPDTRYKVCFKDAMNYVTPCTLDKATKDYGEVEQRVKGVFPYQKLDIDTLEQELLRTKPYSQEDFWSDLKQCSISYDEYLMYRQDFKRFKNFYEYVEYYNKQDTQIMFAVIDNIIKLYAQDHVDCLNSLSISSLASQIKYLKCYDDFDPKQNYKSETVDPNNKFTLFEGYWKSMVKRYKDQDDKAERDSSQNVTEKDFAYYKKLMENGRCWSCQCQFSWDNKPTLDRINNSIGHTKQNCRLACLYCNVYCRDLDADTRAFFKQFKRYAKLKGLPYSLEKAETIHLLTEGITGGLSTVHHRRNIRGENTITKLLYHEENNTIEIIDTGNVISHFIGVDFNSLYPSSFSGAYHPCNKYTGGKMYMPGRVLEHSIVTTEEQLKRCQAIIHSKERFTENGQLFVAKIRGYIPKNRLNDCINFLPIIRNLDIVTDEQTIGNYMYKYMKDNGYKTDTIQKKLTQTWDTAVSETQSGYMIFSSYYLWFLIDQFGFIVEDVSELVLFSKHLAFENFVNSCMSRRQQAMVNKNGLIDKHNKNMMNSSYGYDSMRTDNYNTTKFVTKKEAVKKHRSPYHVDTIHIKDNRYLSVVSKKDYEIETPLQCALFTLDNAKYWYLNFIYNFMHKCLDMNRIHFVEGDTDSQYWAVSGNIADGEKQAFKYVIKDEKFYNENVFKWLPYDFYCTDESYRPILETKKEQIQHEKKLLGCAIEKQGFNIVALGPKCYTTWGKQDDEEQKISMKVKGVSLQTNPHIITDSYVEILDKQNKIDGTNYMLQYRRIDQTIQSTSNEQVVKSKMKQLKEELKQLQQIKDETPFLIAQKSSLKQDIDELKIVIQNKAWTDYTPTNVYKYCRLKLNKIALTGVHIKMKVNDDQCQTCTPLYLEVSKDNEGYVACNIQKEYINENSKYVFDYKTFSKRITAYDEDEDEYIEFTKYGKDVPEYLKFPCRNYEKCCRFQLSDRDNPAMITGCALNVSISPFCIIDFDINKSLTSLQRRNVFDHIVQKYQLRDGIVKTTSGGIHYYCKADAAPSWYHEKARYVKVFQSKNYDIDVFIANKDHGQSWVIWPGSKAETKTGIGSYQKKGDWNYSTLENFSDFDRRFTMIEKRKLIPNSNPEEERWMLKSFQKLSIGLEHKKVGRKVTAPTDSNELNWSVLEKLQGKTLHGHGSMSLFKLLRILSFFDEETYNQAYEWITNNCEITANAENSVKNLSREMFRNRYSCKNGNAELRIFVRLFDE